MAPRRSIVRLREALPLAMALHRAIMRQGSSIIDKHDIRTLHGHRVVTITQGPDLALFAHPGVLSRLALWLVEALRDRMPGTQAAFSRSRRKALPLVLACMNEREGTFMVVGVMGALDYGDVRKKCVVFFVVELGWWLIRLQRVWFGVHGREGEVQRKGASRFIRP